MQYSIISLYTYNGLVEVKDIESKFIKNFVDDILEPFQMTEYIYKMVCPKGEENESIKELIEFAYKQVYRSPNMERCTKTLEEMMC